MLGASEFSIPEFRSTGPDRQHWFHSSTGAMPDALPGAALSPVPGATTLNTQFQTSIDSLNSYDPNTPPISANSVISPFTVTAPQLPAELPFSEKRRGHTLAEKRSFLVRMVSDPKCYNPKIVRHLNLRNHKQMSQDLMRDRTMRLVNGNTRGLFCGPD